MSNYYLVELYLFIGSFEKKTYHAIEAGYEEAAVRKAFENECHGEPEISGKYPNLECSDCNEFIYRADTVYNVTRADYDAFNRIKAGISEQLYDETADTLKVLNRPAGNIVVTPERAVSLLLKDDKADWSFTIARKIVKRMTQLEREQGSPFVFDEAWVRENFHYYTLEDYMIAHELDINFLDFESGVIDYEDDGVRLHVPTEAFYNQLECHAKNATFMEDQHIGRHLYEYITQVDNGMLLQLTDRYVKHLKGE